MVQVEGKTVFNWGWHYLLADARRFLKIIWLPLTSSIDLLKPDVVVYTSYYFYFQQLSSAVLF